MANKLNALEGRNIDSLTVSCCIGASSCDAHFLDFRLMMIGFAIKKESVVQSNSHKKAGTVAGQKKCNIFPSAVVNRILVYPRVHVPQLWAAGNLLLHLIREEDGLIAALSRTGGVFVGDNKISRFSKSLFNYIAYRLPRKTFLLVFQFIDLRWCGFYFIKTDYRDPSIEFWLKHLKMLFLFHCKIILC